VVGVDNDPQGGTSSLEKDGEITHHSAMEIVSGGFVCKESKK
jgi:hypothetical protein